MPRIGNVYSPPAGTKGIPNTTIQSAPYNALVDDLTTDANAARPVTAGGTGATTASGARTALGLAIGTNVQAYDAGLESIAGLTTSADQMLYTTASDAYATTALTPFARTILDDADAAAARTTLGLGGYATLDPGAFGWGADNANVNIPDDNADTLTVNGVFRTTNTTVGVPLASSIGQLVHMGQAANVAAQLWFITNTGLTRFFRRTRSTANVWTDWVEAVDANLTITAGTGLTGGGDLSANRTLAVSYGTAAGTAAQGNDSRIVNAVPNSRTVSAGNGLTGGGDLSADRSFAVGAGTGITVAASAVSVNFGTTSSTACVGNDARLSDSREWTASTVSQSEAEAGTATTRRAWTAQRVAQAIAALAPASPVGLYTGSSRDNTNFPVGHSILAHLQVTSIVRNASVTVYTEGTAGANQYRYADSPLAGGEVLAGTWRSRGMADPAPAVVLLQRTA